MRHLKASCRWLAVAMVLPAALVPVPAFASGFQLVEQNASGLGNAYAGQAAGARDASAIYYNPALLTRLEGKSVVISVEPIGVKTEFSDSGSGRPYLPSARGDTTLPVPLGSLGGDAGGWIPVPNGYVSWQAGKNVWLGLGVNAPFGLKTEWAGEWMGRFHATKSEVKTININPTVAVKLGDAVSLGAGVSAQRLTAELNQGVAFGGIAVGIASSVNPLAVPGILAQMGGPAGLAKEGTGSVKGDDWAVGFNAGATFAMGEQGRVGFSYRSKTKFDISGDAKFEGAPTFAETGPLGALGAAINSRFASGPVTAAIELPDTLSAALAYESGKAEFLADWTWTGWSSIQDLTIKRSDGSTLSNVPLKFKDTWRAGAGVNYALSEKTKLRFGTAYDKAPVQDAYRTPRLPDENRWWAAAGVEMKVGKSGTVDFGYAHLFVSDASSNLPNQDTPSSAPTGKLIGTYKEKVNILGVQYRHTF